ncbi:MAG: PIN domain-containing protein [Xanthomonadales bacterium]|nr:PIN domain-containing protein [Xanthomonadales bacterium]
MCWCEVQAADAACTTAITFGEMLYEVRILPPGHRRDRLLKEVEAIFSIDVTARVLSYDEAAADAHAEIAAHRRALGQPGSQADLMIAGIVRSHGATLATRNTRDFADCGIALIDPWR